MRVFIANKGTGTAKISYESYMMALCHVYIVIEGNVVEVLKSRYQKFQGKQVDIQDLPNLLEDIEAETRKENNP